MSQSMIAICIVLATLVLYLIPGIPIYVTTILSCLAMSLFGIISYDEALSGFSNSAALLIVGMMIMGQACLTTGIATRLGHLVGRYATLEKRFVIMLMIIGLLLGTFLNGALVVPLLMAVANVVIYQSDGKITRKACYMPISFGAVFGNNLTSISASSTVTATALIVAAGYKPLGVFEFTMVTLPGTLACLLFYNVIGYRLSQKVWNFEEVPLEGAPVSPEEVPHTAWKQAITVCTFVLVIAMIVMKFNMGFASLLGACILILTGCIGGEAAIHSVSWSTYIIAACALGMSAGLDASGGGSVIANFIFDISGPVGQSPLGMCILLFLAATILSNLMSDNATVAIMVPIALSIAQAMDWDVLPLVISAAVGAKVALSTPVCVTCHTMVATAGYRFTDYFIIGGIMNLIQLAVTVIMLKVIYF